MCAILLSMHKSIGDNEWHDDDRDMNNLKTVYDVIQSVGEKIIFWSSLSALPFE